MSFCSFTRRVTCPGYSHISRPPGPDGFVVAFVLRQAIPACQIAT